MISFIVMNYNYGRFLGDCLRSIFQQAGDHSFEVIVVDDASTDNSKEVIASFSDRRLRPVFHAKNQGHIATLTTGYGEARGRYIARIDADDRYLPCFLNTVIPVLETHPTVGLVYAEANLIGDKGQVYRSTIENRRDSRGYILPAILERNFITAPTTIARREAWDKAMPIPKDYHYTDWYISLCMARHYEVCHVGKTVSDYRVHSANLHSQLVQDRSEEMTTFRILDAFFKSSGPIAAQETEKERARGKIYASHYLQLAMKYFGRGAHDEARRCYLEASKYSRRALFRGKHLRYFALSHLDGQTYAKLKRALGR